MDVNQLSTIRLLAMEGDQLQDQFYNQLQNQLPLVILPLNNNTVTTNKNTIFSSSIVT